jgi:hypothetical protein
MKIKQLKNITDKIRKYQKYEPPQPRNKMLPPTYNIVLSASPKGGGKSYNCIQLLTNYEESGFISEKGEDVKMRTIWISGGTSRSKQNSILDSLKTLHDDDRIDVEYDVDNTLKEIYEDIKMERDLVDIYNVYRKTYDKFIKSKSLSNLSLEELTLLQYKNFVDPKDDPDAPRDKDDNILYHPRMVFLIVDDLIGSDAFSSIKRGNFLNRLAVKSRHESEELVGMNLFFITQSFKAIPALIRKQSDIFVLLKSASRSYIIDAISEEVGSHFSKQEIEEYYDEVMKIPYGSLILSIHKKELPGNRVRMGWNQVIERDEKYIN